VPVFSALVSAPSIARHPNQMNLLFSPWVAGRTYTPCFTTNLAPPFAPLTDYTGPTTKGAERIITDTNAIASNRFYRLRISLARKGTKL
jgi:hypothetical protein